MKIKQQMLQYYIPGLLPGATECWTKLHMWNLYKKELKYFAKMLI